MLQVSTNSLLTFHHQRQINPQTGSLLLSSPTKLHQSNMSPSSISSREIAEAVLQSVNGFYPETDEVSSAELIPDVLPAILSSLEQSILKTKVCHLVHEKKAINKI